MCAEVVKLELPQGTDGLRGLAPVHEGHALFCKTANRGKQGTSLDLRQAAGRELFMRLIEGFDVLVENFRTGTLDGWGLDIATLHARNPRLIVLRLTGFGQTCPHARKPGFARIFQSNVERTRNLAAIDGIVVGWCAGQSLSAVSEQPEAAEVPFGKVCSIADAMQDPHFHARGDFVELQEPQLGVIPVPGVVPRFVGRTPPHPSAGPATGQDNAAVYGSLGAMAAQLAQLQAAGVI